MLVQNKRLHVFCKAKNKLLIKMLDFFSTFHVFKFKFFILEFSIDYNQTINFAIHIAKGMDFLHNLDPSVSNLHLNSKHIMVNILF